MTYWRQQQIQPQGFYHPYMPGPNIAGGIQGFIDRLQQQEMYQQQLEQQKWERGITERRTTAYEKQVEPTAPKTPEFLQKAQILHQTFPDQYPSMGHAVKDVIKLKDESDFPGVIPSEFEKDYLVPRYTKDWKAQITPETYWKEYGEYNLRTRPVKIPKTKDEYQHELYQIHEDAMNLKTRTLITFSTNMAKDPMVQMKPDQFKGVYQEELQRSLDAIEQMVKDKIDRLNELYKRGDQIKGVETKVEEEPAESLIVGTITQKDALQQYPDATVYSTPEGYNAIDIGGGKRLVVIKE